MGVKVREKVKGSGEWWIFIHHKGRRRNKYIGRDKKFGQQVAKEIEARLTLREFDIEVTQKKIPSLKDYGKHWLETYIKGIRRENTYIRYAGILKKYIMPSAIGKVPLNRLKRSDIKLFLMQLYNDGLSKSSVGLANHVLSGIMTHALDEELIPVNPVLGIIKHLNMSRTKKTIIEPMTHEEVSKFLKNSLEYFPNDYPFFLTAFRTGMRLGELLALEWSDVNWNNKFIRVNKSYKVGKVGPTKNGRERSVDMSDALYAEISNLSILRKKEAFKEGKGDDCINMIFHRKGKYIEQNYIRRVYKRILKKTGLHDYRFHDIRHTFASLLLSDGASPVYVKEQLGHHSIQQTVDTYGHLIPGSNREAINRLDNAPKRTLYAPSENYKSVTS